MTAVRISSIRKLLKLVLVATAVGIMFVVSWSIYELNDALTYDGDRRNSNASPQLFEKEAHLRAELLETNRLELGPRPGFEFCFAPIGGHPHFYNPVIKEKGYQIESVVGPLEIGADSDWHLLEIDHNKKLVREIAFGKKEFGMVDELDPKGVCGNRLLLRISGTLSYDPAGKYKTKKLIVERLR